MKRAWLVLVVVALAASDASAQRARRPLSKLVDAAVEFLSSEDGALVNDVARAAREAHALLAEGRHREAIDVLREARLAWPESPLLAHMIADVYDGLGDAERALHWYGEAASLGEPFRAHYHMGQITYERATADLDAAAIPDGPLQTPEHAQAVRAGIDALDVARAHFLDALLERPDAPASESVSAITKRIDELQELLDEFEEQQEGEGEGEGDEGDGDGEEPDDAPDDSGDEGEGDDGEDGDRDDDDQPDDQQDRPEDEGDDPPDDEDGEEGEGPPPTGAPVPPQALSPEQMQRLEDKLEQMAELAARLDALARQREREAGERDW